MNEELRKEFEQNKYIILKKFIDQDQCENGVKRLFDLDKEGKLDNGDLQVGNTSSCVYGDPFFDSLLEEIAPVYSELIGKNLEPAYSYARIYRAGAILKEHVDRPACEHSITLCLGYSGDNWPIKFNTNEYTLEQGDAALYLGCEIPHSRDDYEPEDPDSWVCQVFLHYVDSEGPYKDYKYDERSELGTPSINKKYNEIDQVSYYWMFDRILTEDYCDSLIGKFSYKDMLDAGIGGQDNNSEGIINKEIRNVKNYNFPLDSNIVAMMLGYSFLANRQSWQFDIDEGIQSEYLKYDIGGKYLPHTDSSPMTYLNPMSQRKLTTLAFLNDNFEGGKFFINIGDTKIYPNQHKGTIITFPSYLMHGVEPVEKGIRHCIVCWVSGPKLR